MNIIELFNLEVRKNLTRELIKLRFNLKMFSTSLMLGYLKFKKSP